MFTTRSRHRRSYTEPAPPRLRFRLRTALIAVTGLCLVLAVVVEAWHISRVRSEMLHGRIYYVHPFGSHDDIEMWYRLHHLTAPRRSVPLVRSFFFDDKPVILIELRRGMDPALRRDLMRYFPEAVFVTDGRQVFE